MWPRLAARLFGKKWAFLLPLICLAFLLLLLISDNLSPISSDTTARTNSDDYKEMYWQNYREMYRQHGPLVIPPKIQLEAMSRAELEDMFHRYVENIQLACRNMIHYGLETDGGYYFCEDTYLTPPCMMYSFGTRNDYSFDDEIANKVGCDVHSFDPGDGQRDHKRSERVWFHKIGLGGYTRFMPDLKWRIYSLQDTRKLLGHTNRTLDILKIDTEGMIWETLTNISFPGIIDDVRMLIIESHTQIPVKKPVYYRSKEDYVENLCSLRRLYHLGFRIYYSQRWPMCIITDDQGNKRTGCHDIHFVQTKFFY